MFSDFLLFLQPSPKKLLVGIGGHKTVTTRRLLVTTCRLLVTTLNFFSFCIQTILMIILPQVELVGQAVDQRLAELTSDIVNGTVMSDSGSVLEPCLLVNDTVPFKETVDATRGDVHTGVSKQFLTSLVHSQQFLLLQCLRRHQGSRDVLTKLTSGSTAP